jgi:hypothetical protein
MCQELQLFAKFGHGMVKHTPDLGHLSTDLNHTDTKTVPMIAFAVLIVLLMMGAESTRNM